MEEKPLAAIYLRVSRRDQHPENQLPDLIQYIDRRGWRLFRQPFVDHGFSGAKGENARPALKDLLSYVRRRQIDFIVVWQLSRFGRSLVHNINLFEELKSLGVGFCSYKEGIDSESLMGKAMFVLNSLWAEMERDFLIERTLAGLERARANGTKLGHPFADINKEELLERRAQGGSLRQLARHFGVTKSTIARHLLSRIPGPNSLPLIEEKGNLN